jgi:hypothetical protein
MDYSHALRSLRNHANGAGSTLPEGESFLFVLWQAGRESRAPELQHLFDDILACLETVNHALNTEHPSKTVAGKAEAVPRSLVADVSAILHVGWSDYWRWSLSQQFSESFREELAVMLVQIGIAWEAVLAGDIDDILEHVRTACRARGYVV